MASNTMVDAQKQTNTNLKMQLLSVSSQIEESLKNAKQPQEMQINDEMDENERKNNKKFFSQLEEKKRAIADLRKLLDNSSIFNEIQIKENSIKYNINKLKEYKTEYDTTMNIIKNQQKSLDEIDNQLNAKNEINTYKLRLNSLKEEMKIIKDSNINSVNTIKAQNKKIMELNDQCKLITENIQCVKRNQNREKMLENKKFEQKLSEKVKDNQKKTNDKIYNYEREIKNQERKINDLDQEIEILKVKLRHKKKQIYIAEEKRKQIEKFQKEAEQFSSSPNNNMNINKKTDNTYIDSRQNKDSYFDTNNNNVNKPTSSVTRDNKRKPPFIIKGLSNQKKPPIKIKVTKKEGYISPEKEKINNELEQLSKSFLYLYIFRK